ncbi:universal stress protein [Saccharicrinis aurantiacus]|uniref:universal stress protein n=1 Tax=Saccharicrinis aurantiacus TaxID=1849719 RepID=UPI0008391188|nr:universal stress protein [Saccharicrinis aurantiacus]
MSDKIITLATVTYEKAQLIKSLLDNDGVSCFLEHVNLIQGAISTGVKININEADFETAIGIFDALREVEYSDKHNAIPDYKSDFKILVPIDFSEYSNKAIDIAFDWVCKIKGEITLFNCYFSPLGSALNFGDTNMYDVNAEELSMSLRVESEAKMEKCKNRLEEKIEKEDIKGVSVKTSIQRGVAEYEILNYADEYKPSILVMGTRGADKKVVDLIGSVTAEIIEMAKVPVLAVPEKFDYKGIDQLLSFAYLAIFEEPDYLALEKLLKILNPLNANITCAHVTKESDLDKNRIKMEHLENYTKKKLEGEINFEMIQNDDFWLGIEDFVQEKKINVLSFTTYKRNLITRLLNPSVAKKMLFHSTTPLLVFHAK